MTPDISAEAWLGAAGCAGGGDDMENRAAFRANDRILVEVIKFRRAGLAVALGAEFGFGHGS